MQNVLLLTNCILGIDVTINNNYKQTAYPTKLLIQPIDYVHLNIDSKIMKNMPVQFTYIFNTLLIIIATIKCINITEIIDFLYFTYKYVYANARFIFEIILKLVVLSLHGTFINQ